jgi:carbon-monoxide dehydrogenase large subunit
MPGKFVGQPVRRIEDPRLVRGQGCFLDDMRADWSVVFVRSTHSHATFVVDRSEARRVPGVLDVVDARDFVPMPTVPVVIGHPSLRPCGEPLLANDRVRYVGQPLAAVVARSPYAAADAAAAVAVEYVDLAPVTDAQAALDPTSAILHPVLGDNLAGRIEARIGDPAAVFEMADVIVRGRFDSHRYSGQPLETRGAMASFDAGTRTLTLWTSTQWPHTVRDGLRQVVDLPEHRIRVVAPDVGGGFGIKQEVYPEEVLLCLLAMRVKGTLKWTETRTEHFTAANHSREQSHIVELAATHDGIVKAMRVEATTDMGAYTRSLGLLAPSCSAAELPGPYRIRDYAIDLACVLTNKTPIGVYRGAGLPEAVYATERAMDRLAARLSIDPADLRRRNLITPRELPWDTGLSVTQLEFVYDSGDYAAVLDRALEAVDYTGWRVRQQDLRAGGRLVGIGLASFVLLSGLGPYESADVRIDPSGRVGVITGSSPHGQGLATVIAQVVADVFDVAPDDVDVSHGDTARIPYGQGTYASRSGVTASNAAYQASRRVLEKALALAEHRLEANRADLVVEEGHVLVRGSPDRRLSLGELATAAAPGSSLPDGMEPGLEDRSYFDAPRCTFTVAAHAAVVEVDPDLGTLTVHDYVAVTDPGRVLNPLVAIGQIVGGFAQGLGGTMSEQLVYDETGQLLTTSFVDYLIPRSTDPLPVRPLFMETPSPLNPLGVKGLGEAGTVGVPATLANATEDALRPLGIEIDATPLTAARLHALIEAARTSQSPPMVNE